MLSAVEKHLVEAQEKIFEIPEKHQG